MILQQLCRDANFLVDLTPSMYDQRPIRWVVQLDEEGKFINFQVTSGDGKVDRGLSRLVPFRNRSSGIAPILLADKPSYTFGVFLPNKSEKKDRSAQEHESYLALLDRCANATNNQDVAFIAAFLRSRKDKGLSLPPTLLADDWITFQVEDRFPFDDPNVQEFWAAEASADDTASQVGQCLICGKTTRVVERLPVVIKGIPHGHSTGVAFVTINKNAYESYGRKNALTSSICASCAEKFGKALNALLKNPKKHLNIGPVSYVFWTKESTFDVWNYLNNPDSEEVKQLLQSAKTGKLQCLEDTKPFYAASLSATIKRGVVRSWLHTTVDTVQQNLQQWFRIQEIVDKDGKLGEPLSIFRLSASIYRESKDIQVSVPDQLLRSALYGEPLPLSLLQQVIQRNRVERNITYARAALTKAILMSYCTTEETRLVELDTENPNPAYHCGRLLAQLNEIQRSAVPGIKATIVSRYYSSAASSPASIFGILLNSSQRHLDKLRKTREFTYKAHKKRLEEIMQHIKEFPRTLTLQDQATFSLGYYHQCASMRAQMLAKKNIDKLEMDNKE